MMTHERLTIPVSRRGATALALSILLPITAGALGAIFTSAAIPIWYTAIEKPTWNPPPWLFGPAWTFLYITMGVSAWLVWRSGQEGVGALNSNIRTALLWYAAQLGVNAVWSPIFFGAKRIDLALAVIALLLVLIVVTIRRFYLVRPLAGVLLAPYLVWVIFATILNATIWQLNR